jgi:hypothetical protein
MRYVFIWVFPDFLDTLYVRKKNELALFHFCIFTDCDIDDYRHAFRRL